MNDTKELTTNTRHLRTRLTSAMFALLIAFVAVAAATYAWYIYNTSRHTTKVKMAAGTGINIQISNTYDGEYGSAAVLNSFTGRLTPVSTDKISGGFQKAEEFVRGTDSQPELVAGIFGQGDETDYYHTKMYIRTNGGPTDVYLSGIGYTDSDSSAPISTAIRVGLVVHEPGERTPAAGEYIFAINDAQNPEALYNTQKGQAGDVLDSSKADGSTVPFTPLTSAAYCKYNENTGEVTGTDTAQKLFIIQGAGKQKPGTPVEVELYIWLEGCDPDCTANLCEKTLENLAVTFAGVERK